MTNSENDESALVVLVPESEPAVGPFRARYDPAAADGMPAHITVLYPFKPPAEITQMDLDALADLFAGKPHFATTLRETRSFPDVLYLAPEPEEPFRDLIHAVETRFPETPPYGGVFDEVIPHLTIAHADSPAEVARIAAQFDEASGGLLPIEVEVGEVQLMRNLGEGWEAWHVFRLGS